MSLKKDNERLNKAKKHIASLQKAEDAAIKSRVESSKRLNRAREKYGELVDECKARQLSVYFPANNPDNTRLHEPNTTTTTKR